MKKNGPITAFYLETLLLIVVFIAIILVLTNIFGLGQRQSAAAQRLTGAVSLAQNAAEAVAASDSAEALLALLDENGNAAPLPDGAGVEARYDASLAPDPAGAYRVAVSWEPDGALARCVIAVRWGGGDEPVYTLETAVYTKEATAA